MDDPLIWVRTIHFASTLLVSGTVFFLIFIAEPSFRESFDHGATPAFVRRQLRWLAFGGLLVLVFSGAGWLLLQTANMIELPLGDEFSEAALGMVLRRTGFGHDWIVRLGLVVLLIFPMLALTWEKSTRPRWIGLVAVGVAAGLVGSLAWAGHAAATPGAEGTLHLAADIIHLIAAAAWLGSLIPLALLLGAAIHKDSLVGQVATRRFSALGIASVGALVATGFINGWILVGTPTALVNSSYGRLLLVKLALFLVMLSVAAVNRLVLTPDILNPSSTSKGSRTMLGRLQRNALIEATLGAIIVVIVGVLGTLPPAAVAQ